jgi:transposase
VDLREQRGLQLAATRHIRKKGDLWVVPSGTDPDAKYTVDPAAGSCSCPDHETRRIKCKHVFAVEYTIQRETDANGRETVTETLKVTRKTYKQNWPAYNAAQTNEKRLVAELLHKLCRNVPTAPQKGSGQRRLPMPDVIFAAAMKVYGGLSGRRTTSDLDAFVEEGLLSRAPHYNSIFLYLEDEAMGAILRGLIEESANPLRAVERDFAVDSTGIATSCFDRWYDQKYGASVKKAAYRKFLKCHAMCGVKTHIITAIEVTDGDSNDSPHLPKLLEATAAPGRFTPVEVSADKGYLSKENQEAIVKKGAAAFIPFKSNSTEGRQDDLWRKLFYFFNFKRDEFLTHYHKRSNVESVFSMMKAKFGGSVRSKLDVAQRNEILLKVLCHNLCVLVQSIFEFGLEPTFWPEKTVEVGARSTASAPSPTPPTWVAEEREGVW